MDLAVFFGLASALCYGAGDLLWRVAGRGLGVWRSSFYGAIVGVVLLSVWLLLAPALVHAALRATPGAWQAAVGSGIALEGGSLLLTQGLVSGSLAVVAPVTATYAAVATILAVLSGERFTAIVAVGLTLIMAGVCVVAMRRQESIEGPHSGTGLGWAMGAALAYGGGVWLQGRFAVPELGAIVPVWVMHALGVVMLGTVCLARRTRLSLPERGSRAPILAAASLGVGGFIAMTAGFATGAIAVVVVLSSLASAITVLLGRLFGATHVAIHQWLAIVAIVAGLALIHR
ncbi:MAG TPA: DMT family transporter [Steroidobacteraceae bacterium]|nr:DMT family transporter [Steroidobacteraceae bacterium]